MLRYHAMHEPYTFSHVFTTGADTRWDVIMLSPASYFIRLRSSVSPTPDFLHNVYFYTPPRSLIPLSELMVVDGWVNTMTGHALHDKTCTIYSPDRAASLLRSSEKFSDYCRCSDYEELQITSILMADVRSASANLKSSSWIGNC